MFKIFTIFKHLNSLFTIICKAIFNMTFQFLCYSKSLQTITTKTFSSMMLFMIIYECIEIFDKNIVVFLSFTYQ